MWDKTFRILLRFPDVAMVRFCVLDDDFVGDDFIGQYSLPLSSIQPGLATALFSFGKASSFCCRVSPHSLVFKEWRTP